MTARFTVLASGSSGNASLLQVGGFGVLLDAGLGPRTLSSRLAAAGAQWRDVNAVLLTHTHGDHWKDATFETLHRQRVPFYCHADHRAALGDYSPAFAKLDHGGLVRTYEPGRELPLCPALRATPIEVSHDSDPTFGFRLEGSPNLFGPAWSLGYLADLGCWTDALADAFAGVDVLGVEFNHDERMERTSGRPWQLIQRCLGDFGHLSNTQAGQFVEAVIGRSEPGKLRHVVQLHLSRHCNRPHLAVAAAHRVLARCQVKAQVHTAHQDHVIAPIVLDEPARKARRAAW